MITEEDKKRIGEANNCSSCPNWLKYCKAECCKSATIQLHHVVLNEKGKYLKVRQVINKNLQRYWELRGVR